jgi:hypothetical protein
VSHRVDTFLFSVGNNVKELIRDMRRVMEPFTAANLKVMSIELRRHASTTDEHLGEP